MILINFAKTYQNSLNTKTNIIYINISLINSLDSRKITIRSETDPEPTEDEEAEQLDWMECAQQIPAQTEAQKNLQSSIDKSFDWQSRRSSYTPAMIENMPKFIEQQKQLEPVSETDSMADVNPEQLNQLQRFTFNIVKEYRVIKTKNFLNNLHFANILILI
jgi:hypothetical protein